MKIYFDKVQHLIVCASIVITIAWLLDHFAPGYHTQAVQVGVICSVAWAVAKEEYDSRQPGNKFDWWDILADTAGIILAVWVL